MLASICLLTLIVMLEAPSLADRIRLEESGRGAPLLVAFVLALAWLVAVAAPAGAANLRFHIAEGLDFQPSQWNGTRAREAHTRRSTKPPECGEVVRTLVARRKSLVPP